MRKVLLFLFFLTLSMSVLAQKKPVISMTFSAAKPFYEVGGKKVYKKSIPGKYVFRLDGGASTLSFYYTSSRGKYGRTLNIKSAENSNTSNGMLLTLGFDNSYEKIYINLKKNKGKNTAEVTLEGNLFDNSTWFINTFCSFFGKDDNGDNFSEIYFPSTQNVTVE